MNEYWRWTEDFLAQTLCNYGASIVRPRHTLLHAPYKYLSIRDYTGRFMPIQWFPNVNNVLNLPQFDFWLLGLLLTLLQKSIGYSRMVYDAVVHGRYFRQLLVLANVVTQERVGYKYKYLSRLMKIEQGLYLLCISRSHKEILLPNIGCLSG